MLVDMKSQRGLHSADMESVNLLFTISFCLKKKMIYIPVPESHKTSTTSPKSLATSLILSYPRTCSASSGAWNFLVYLLEMCSNLLSTYRLAASSFAEPARKG